MMRKTRLGSLQPDSTSENYLEISNKLVDILSRENNNSEQTKCLRMSFGKRENHEILDLETNNTRSGTHLMESMSSSSGLSESFDDDFSGNFTGRTSEMDQFEIDREIESTQEASKISQAALEEEIDRWLENNSTQPSLMITSVNDAIHTSENVVPVYPEPSTDYPTAESNRNEEEEKEPETECVQSCDVVNTSEQQEESAVVAETTSIEETKEEMIVTGENEHITSVHFQLALPPIVSVAEPEYTEKELVHAIKELMTRNQRPPVEMIDPLRVYIKKELCNAIMEQNYDEAEYMKQAEGKLGDNQQNEKEANEEKKKKVRSVEERIENQKQKIEELKEKWAEKIQSFEAEKKERLQEMEQKHEEELDDFEAHWNDPSTMIVFSKPSSQLLQIRKLQRTAALSNDFTRAKELKARADALERTETRQAERKATASMKAAYKTLTEKQKKEKEFALMNWRRQLLMIQGERDAELQNARLCLKQLEIKKTEASHARPLSCISRPRKDTKTLTTPTTPRTRKQMADFKCMSNQEKLTLMGFNPTEFMRSKRSKPISSRRPVI